jgi:hypothetical protein
MASMRCSAADLASFWSAPWFAPLRAACRWLISPAQPLPFAEPPIPVPGWIKPLCVQRLVWRAILARLAWMQAHPDTAEHRFGRESEPSGKEAAWASYQRAYLREFSEQRLLWFFGIEVERLLRSVQESPLPIGASTWTQAVLGACEHLAQVYAELKRRYKAREARALVREELRIFIFWEGWGTIKRTGR